MNAGSEGVREALGQGRVMWASGRVSPFRVSLPDQRDRRPGGSVRASGMAVFRGVQGLVSP